MIIPKIDAVIFDFDGTICDSLQVKEEAFGELYREYGKKISHKVDFHRENLGVPREKFVHFQKNIVKVIILKMKLVNYLSCFPI